MEGHDPPLTPEVLLEHAAWVRRLAGELVRDPGAAEDVAQETWMAFLRRRPSMGRPLRPWLARVVRNQAALWARGAAGRRAREAEVARPEQVPSSDELVGRAEVQRRLVDAVLGLEEPYRSAVLLRYYEGLEPIEIAALQRIPAATVRTHLFRGLARLRERLDTLHEGDRAAWAGLLMPLLAPTSQGVATGTAGAVGVAVVMATVVFLGWLGWRGSGPESAREPLVGPAARSAGERTQLDGAAGAGGAQEEGERVALATSQWGTARLRAGRLVDAGGRALAGYAVRVDGRELRSDAEGRLELPADARTLLPIDDPRLALDRPSSHGLHVRSALESAALELEPILANATLEPVDIEVPAGPSFLVELEAPRGADGLEFEARWSNGPLSAQALAPLRPPGYGFASPWVRFGQPGSGEQGRLELCDGAGFWRGEGIPGAAHADGPRSVRIALAETGVLAGELSAGPADIPDDLVLFLMPPGGGMPLRWIQPQGAGSYELRWLPPGEYHLVASSKRVAPLERAVTVQAGRRTRADLAFSPQAPAGDLAGVVRSESGAHQGQVLVFLCDVAGDVLDVFPATWREADGARAAAFRFRDAPEGELRLEVVSLAAVLAFRVEPQPLTAPSETVLATLLDGGPRADWAFDVRDAASGEPLERFELEVRVEGGPRVRFLAEPPMADGAEPDGLAPLPTRSWNLQAGGMRWNRFEGPAPIRGLGAQAALSWTLRAEGHAPQEGDASAFVEPRPGLRVARVALEPL